MVGLEITMPRSVTADDVVAFLSNLHGLARPRWLVLDRPSVLVELEAVQGRIRHVVYVHASLVDEARHALVAAIPGVRITKTDSGAMKPEFTFGAELSMTSASRPLRMDNSADASAYILSSMTGLRTTETLRLQWVLAPAPVPQPVRRPNRSSEHRVLLDERGLLDSEERRLLRQKQSEPLFLVVGRVAVAGAHRRRAEYLVGRTLRAVRRVEAPGVRFRRHSRNPRGVARRVGDRAVPRLRWPMTMNARELAGLGLPLEGSSLPEVTTGAARQVAAPSNRARTGIRVATSNALGSDREIRLPLDARRQHCLTVGGTGSGKSSLLANLALQDITDGRGLLLPDPKVDLAIDVEQRIPEARIEDVIVLDAADEHAVVGFNPLATSANTEAGRALVVDQVVGTIRRVFADSWGRRSDDVLRATCSTLVSTTADDGSRWTLADVPGVLANADLRQRLARSVNDPFVSSFWTGFEAMSEAQRAEVVAPLLNKLRSIFLRPQLRRILGQSEGLDFHDIVRGRKIVLVPLAKGQLGEDAARLLGSLLLSQLWLAVQARTRIPYDRRSVFMAYLDEAANFTNLPIALEDMLAEARGLGLAVHLATQHLDQFPPSLREAVLSNARTKILFRLGHKDANTMARYTEPLLAIEDLKGLAAYEVAIASGATDHNFTATGVTEKLGPPLHDGSQVRQRSRERHAVPLEDIDSAMARRLELDNGTTPPRLGPRRRGGRNVT